MSLHFSFFVHFRWKTEIDDPVAFFICHFKWKAEIVVHAQILVTPVKFSLWDVNENETLCFACILQIQTKKQGRCITRNELLLNWIKLIHWLQMKLYTLYTYSKNTLMAATIKQLQHKDSRNVTLRLVCNFCKQLVIAVFSFCLQLQHLITKSAAKTFLRTV